MYCRCCEAYSTSHDYRHCTSCHLAIQHKSRVGPAASVAALQMVSQSLRTASAYSVHAPMMDMKAPRDLWCCSREERCRLMMAGTCGGQPGRQGGGNPPAVVQRTADAERSYFEVSFGSQVLLDEMMGLLPAERGLPMAEDEMQYKAWQARSGGEA